MRMIERPLGNTRWMVSSWSSDSSIVGTQTLSSIPADTSPRLIYAFMQRPPTSLWARTNPLQPQVGDTSTALYVPVMHHSSGRDTVVDATFAFLIPFLLAPRGFAEA